MTTRDFQTRSPMRIFLSYFRPHRGLFLLDMTCAFFISLVGSGVSADLAHSDVTTGCRTSATVCSSP